MQRLRGSRRERGQALMQVVVHQNYVQKIFHGSTAEGTVKSRRREVPRPSLAYLTLDGK